MRAATFLFAVSLLNAVCLAGASGAARKVPVEGGSAEEKAAGMTWKITPDAALPDVLLIGDSISIGYTLPARAALKGVANVFRPMDADGKKPANCGDTARGLKDLDEWLGDRPWRVIHFNFGLHDLKWLDAKGQYVSPDQGKQVAPPEKYEANLREFVARLKKTGAILVWGSTTPVPDGSAGRVHGDERAYNAVAEKVMKENGVLVDDLCGALGARVAELQKPHNVHFTDEGSKVLADSVAASVRLALAKPWTAPPRAPSGPVAEFTLPAPVEEVVSREVRYQTVAVRLRRPVVFKPGLVVEVAAEVETAAEPSSFSIQIISKDGKASRLALKDSDRKKSVSGRVEIPANPPPHPAAHNKEPWKEGDLISEVHLYFTFPAPVTSTVRVKALTIRAP